MIHHHLLALYGLFLPSFHGLGFAKTIRQLSTGRPCASFAFVPLNYRKVDS